MGKAEFSLLGEMEKFKVKDNEVAKGNGEGFEELGSKQPPGRQENFSNFCLLFLHGSREREFS